MDQSLKERLIGAAVLVALGVWLIPWLLDGRQEQPNLGSSSSALRLPAPDGPLPVRSQTLTLDPAKSDSDPFVPDAARAEARAEPTTIAAAETATTPTPAPSSTQPAGTAAPQRVATAAPTKPGGESSTTQRATPAPATKPAEPPAAAHAAPARADARGDWAVQLGVFSAEDNARRLAQKVNVYGYRPEVVSYKPNGRTMYRVRLGPYTSRAEADATASALSAHSFTAQVVAAD
jgi:DedD protein